MIRGKKQLRHGFLIDTKTDWKLLQPPKTRLIKFCKNGERAKQNKKNIKIGSELKLFGCRPIKGVVVIRPNVTCFCFTEPVFLDNPNKLMHHMREIETLPLWTSETIRYHCPFQLIFFSSFCDVEVQVTRKINTYRETGL